MTERLLFQYDGALREHAYALREIGNAWQAHVGVIVPRGLKPEEIDDEARERLELAMVEQAITHIKNTLRTLVKRRDELFDALVIVERPRIEAAREKHEEQQRRGDDFTGDARPDIGDAGE
jgi:hypothetical protein